MYVQEDSFPTSAFDRISLHLMDWLTQYRGYSLEAARTEIFALDKLYNEADPLFDAISNSGKKAYSSGGVIIILSSCAHSERVRS